jgi:hypothetical protein
VPPRLSPARKARAARVIREGGTHAQAAKAAPCCKRTIGRLQKDPEFLLLVRGRGVFQAGPLRVEAAEEDVLHELPTDCSWLWVATASEREPEVLGSLLVEDAEYLRVAFVSPARVGAVRSEIEAHRFPVLAGERTAVLVSSALAALQDPGELALLATICTAPSAEAFRAFLSLWRFRAQETGDVRLLGDHLWPAQETFIAAIAEHPHLYALKARKLGQSTIASAYCGYVLRFRDQNARVHLFSRAERAALELLAAVRFGLEGLPAHLQLPAARTTMREVAYDAGANDRRLVVCYPTTDAVAVEATATHTHVDEWADMPRPDVVYQALEPTFSAPACSSLILTTGTGPANPAAEYWRRCLSGDGLHHPLFIPATARPDRDEAWLAHKRRTMLASQFKTEYALSWEDALAGSSGFLFRSEDIDHCGDDCLRPGPAKRGRRYITAWDIGVRDATVGSVIDVTGEFEVLFMVCQRRFLGLSYPQIVREIERLHAEYPGLTVIENNGVGAAVIGHLDIPEHQLLPFTTSALSKARMIANLGLHLQQWTFKFDPRAFPQLDRELRAYQDPDEYCVQDCVMSVAMALDQAPKAHLGGRLLPVIYF